MRQQGQGSAEGADGGELTVPMAWLYAEYIADELLRTGDLMPPSSFEFRAGREALALTIYLSDTSGELSGIRVISQLDNWLSLTAYEQPWQHWVREQMDALAGEAAGTQGPDLALALEAWRWLEETELLAPDLDAVTEGLPPHPGALEEDEDLPKVWTPAWQLGLPLGHLAIHLF
ncbi:MULTISPECIES: hypothetical protein [Streptomyces]|uniref:Uncharacterized protein n=2 Tax=Streptomyces TaxID=1883 RepID=A0A0B5F0D6_STRA4|nr:MULTISPECIES: hypothetical protein [Streptomyces]AJE87539.1 hypothetical protein SLNWT_7163 [Streptomyces albus]AOU81842.1 hypothetical protein SLNHY_7151 [Streptomyces albus]AYN37528.1 hypothetical protein DUI70_7035 [Streptomyces albus]NKI42126.1 hypothetical protein [Streptomyces physcomitrii]